MKVMSHIRNVRKRMPEIASLFDPMQRIVALLKSNSIPIDLPNIGGQPALDFLEYRYVCKSGVDLSTIVCWRVVLIYAVLKDFYR
jgi:hypothetical protein